MEQQQLKQIIEQLKTISKLAKNLKLMMNLMTNTPKNVMIQHNCNINQALEKIDKAYQFINNNANNYLQTIIDNTKEIIQIIENNNNITPNK